MDQLREAYRLQAARILHIAEIATAPLHAIYRSPVEPRLFVLDKEAAGCKADAINAGINAATSPYICVVDADSILEKESLIRIMAGVFSDPGRVVAVGGIVRVLNGSRVVDNQIEQVRLPKRWIEVMQVIEYLRAFLIGREGWAGFNMLPIISGAFGVFQRDLVQQVGGFRTHAVGEDLDLVDPHAPSPPGAKPRLSHQLYSRSHVLDGSADRSRVSGPTAGALAQGFDRYALAKSGHAVSRPLRPRRMDGSSLHVDLRVLRADHRTRGIHHDHSGTDFGSASRPFSCNSYCLGTHSPP